MFDSPGALWTGTMIAAAAVIISIYRRPALPVLTRVLGTIALVLIALAAGSPTWRSAVREEVAVMVDLSPSTRIALYRDPAVLRERVRQLLGDAPFRTIYFADGETTLAGGELSAHDRLPDLPVARTTFAPPAASAVLLFSDGRFDAPVVAPPTHVVVDPALEEPADAAIERLEARGVEVAVTVRNGGGPRIITVTGSTGPPSFRAPIAAGGTVVTRPLPAEPVRPVAAYLAAGDAWPENDALTLLPAPPAEAERWWVGNGDGGDGWLSLRPADLPVEAAAYLRPGVIVLDNIAASELADVQRQRLRQYLTDLGGGLVILGGDAAFAAGAYAGTVFDALSPLASHPPQPTTHWVFLIDSSGSMNAPAAAAGATRWRAAVDAVARAAASLPPQDLVSVAGFAGSVEWWVRGKPASDVAPGALPPTGARASGPTELRRALQAAVTPAGDALPVELVVVTDANAPVDDPAALAALMDQHRARLHLLDIGDSSGAGLGALRQIVTATDGMLLRESEPARWATVFRRLTRAATPGLLIREPGRVEFIGPLAGTPGRTVAAPWNRTWLRPQATALAMGRSDSGPLAAAWNVGEGKVVAAGFEASPDEAQPFVRLAARAPRDPRLRVTWDAGARLRVSVEAVDHGAGGDAGSFLNGLPLALEVRDAAGAGSGAAAPSTPVPQVAPGRYELSVRAPGAPAFATLRSDGRVVERVAVPGRYPPEYEQIGNDRRAMSHLAALTGGSVVEPSVKRPLPLARSRRNIPLTSPLAAAAAVCLAAALLRWRVA